MELQTENNQATLFNLASIDVKIMILRQMADALEDEAAGLYRRVAVFEEEEFLLFREIEDRQTEINRLQLKLEAMRGERDRVIGKIAGIREEVAAMRDEITNNEEEVALANISCTQLLDVEMMSEQPPGPLYFQRLVLP